MWPEMTEFFTEVIIGLSGGLAFVGIFAILSASLVWFGEVLHDIFTGRLKVPEPVHLSPRDEVIEKIIDGVITESNAAYNLTTCYRGRVLCIEYIDNMPIEMPGYSFKEFLLRYNGPKIKPYKTVYASEALEIVKKHTW